MSKTPVAVGGSKIIILRFENQNLQYKKDDLIPTGARQ